MLTTITAAAAALSVLSPALPADHRTVEMDGTSFHLTLATPTATITPGRPVTIAGHGYNPAQGIFVALCVVPDGVTPGQPATYTSRPTPCLGTRGSGGVSHRVANGATGEHTSPYGPGGSFVVDLTLQPKISDGVECDVNVQCAVVTRADFTATDERRLDLYVPVHFRRK